MNQTEKLERLQQIFRDVLDQPGLRVNENFSTVDCPEWDSVATVQIVLATEAAFGIHIPMEAVAELHSVRELMDLIP